MQISGIRIKQLKNNKMEMPENKPLRNRKKMKGCLLDIKELEKNIYIYI